MAVDGAAFETIVVGLASFVGGAVSTILVASSRFISRAECSSNRDGCLKASKIVENNFNADLKMLCTRIDEQAKWLRLIASKLRVSLDEVP
jgi:hypothetical protein